MKIGLTLSGGGARGIAHLGALKAFDEWGIKPSMISGVSSGAIVGALYAAGLEPEFIIDTLINSKLHRYLRPAWSRFGFLNIEKFIKLYQLYLPVKTFEELKIKLFISATDLKEGKTIYFHEGPILRPILASSCIPVLFNPVSIGDRQYIDGGMLNNLPVEPLLGHTDFIFGINCNPTNKQFRVEGMKSVMERTFHLMLSINVKERIKYCDIYIEPTGLSNFTIFDIKNARAIYKIGYEQTIEMLKSQEELLKKYNIL
jgi:NTE family protein